jgi:hypothetical protein
LYQYEAVGWKDLQCAERIETHARLLARPVLEFDQDSGDKKAADNKQQRNAITAQLALRHIAMHKNHRHEREEPQSIDPFAMFHRLRVVRPRE